MLPGDVLLRHFRKWMYHGGIGSCTLLSLMYSCYDSLYTDNYLFIPFCKAVCTYLILAYMYHRKLKHKLIQFAEDSIKQNAAKVAVQVQRHAAGGLPRTVAVVSLNVAVWAWSVLRQRPTAASWRKTTKSTTILLTTPKGDNTYPPPHALLNLLTRLHYTSLFVPLWIIIIFII